MLTRIAVISDIQGNAIALESVLAKILQDGIDQIICLGDLASGPEPTQVLALLHEYDVICVRGNMDEVLVDPPSLNGLEGDDLKYVEMDRWCFEQLSSADKAFLHDLPLTYASDDLLCFHGSPLSSEDVIAASTPDERLETMLKDTDETILMTGHMHLPMLRTFGDQVIVNPGSVGLPYGGKRLMPTRAEYALLAISEADYAISFHQVYYDIHVFSQRLLTSNMPHAEWYLSQWQTKS